MRHEIDTCEWKEFKVGTLFTMFKPPVLHDRQVLPSANGLPYVVRTKFKNGIKDLVVTDEPVDPSPAGVVTWGSENASFFRQELPFYSGRDIYYLDTRQLSGNACRFLTAILDTITSRYPYNYGLFPDLLKEELIKLPVTPSGDPDWAYMDAYMSGILTEEQAYADELNSHEWHRHSIDSGAWRKYRIGDLFDIRKGTRLTRADMRPGTTPFIGATLENNGITAFVGNDEHIHPGNTITVAYNGQKATGKAFWQPVPFWASDDVSVLYPKFEMTREIALFLAPIFWEVGRPYAFADKWRSEVMADDELPLPSTPSGEPDWNRMDAYMSRLVDEEVGRAAALRGRLGPRQA